MLNPGGAGGLRKHSIMASMAEFPGKPQKDSDKVYFGEEMKELDAHKGPDPETYEIGSSSVKYHTVCREWRFRFTGRDVRRPSAPSPGEMTKKSAPNR